MVSPRTAPIRTGNTSTFTLKQRRLHIILLDPRERPYAGREYVLRVGRTEHCGTTAPDGSLSHEVPGLATGELLLHLPPPDPGPDEPPPPAATRPGQPPRYPPSIRASDFMDTHSPPESPPDLLSWALHLESPATFDADAMTAAQERLHNLGFLIEGERGAPGPRTRAAVRAFQRHHGLTETGQLADVQRELIRRHDT